MLKVLKKISIYTDTELMTKKLKVLLVEDDKRFGESLKRLLELENFECRIAEKPQTALSLCKLHAFDVVVIDCMLPQMNGVELAVKIKEFHGAAMTLFLTSGIYKDKNFTISSIKKTGAKAFLIKPFDAKELIDQLKELYLDSNTVTIQSENPIKNLFFHENLSQNLVSTTIQNANHINGLELPILLSQLVAFKTDGVLKIKNESQELLIHIQDNIVSIPHTPYAGVKLKSLISEKEFVDPDSLSLIKIENLSVATLIQMNYLSPHHGQDLNKESSMRFLRNFIQNKQIEISFTAEKTSPQSIALTQRDFDDFIYSCVLSADIEWLKTYHLPHMQNIIKKLPTSQNKTQSYPLVNGNKTLLAFMLQHKSIDDLLAQSKNEDTCFRLLHLLLIYREFFISTKASTINYASQIERLKKIYDSMDSQTAFERLGLKENATDQDIKRVYTDISQTLHPDKLKDAPQDLIIISAKVYDKIQDAYNNIKSADKRQEYIKIMDAQKIKKQHQAQRSLDEALNHLVRGDLHSAARLISSAVEVAPHLSKTKFLQSWYQLKTKKSTPQDVQKMLASIANDDRDSALYFHVRGLCHVGLNEIEKAQQNFKMALSKENDFMPARRELSLLSQENSKKSTNILKSDLRDVVGLFFNKKPKK